MPKELVRFLRVFPFIGTECTAGFSQLLAPAHAGAGTTIINVDIANYHQHN